MFDDISFLVQETLNESQKDLKQKKFFDKFFDKGLNIPEDSVGILYNLQKNASTFVLRIYPSIDPIKDYKSINKHPDMYPTLRLDKNNSDVSKELQFFECDSFKIANAIKAQLGNKRFPKCEEQVFNISDPADSWWLRRKNNKLTVYFKLSHCDSSDDLIKLGPLGDPQKSLELFSKLYGYFQMIMPLEDYSSGFGQFSISCAEETNPIFAQLIQLFSNGELGQLFCDKLREMEAAQTDPEILASVQKANYFLMEIAQVRKFWAEVQSKIQEEVSLATM